MRTLTFTTTDGVMVVDGIGRVFPELMERQDGLLGVSWDGNKGVLVYPGRVVEFTDAKIAAEWIDHWDRHPAREKNVEWNS